MREIHRVLLSNVEACGIKHDDNVEWEPWAHLEVSFAKPIFKPCNDIAEASLTESRYEWFTSDNTHTHKDTKYDIRNYRYVMCCLIYKCLRSFKILLNKGKL